MKIVTCQKVPCYWVKLLRLILQECNCIRHDLNQQHLKQWSTALLNYCFLILFKE